MSRQRPTIRQLEYLTALARTLNFRLAAEACFVSQPALSNQIQQLERILGTPLFERDRRHVGLTDAGRRLASRAQMVLGDVDELVDDARQTGQPLTGDLRVGVIPTVAPYVLPGVVPALRRRFPQLRLLLREDQTDRLVKSLQSGDLDVLLLAKEADLGGAATLPLYSDPFLLAIPKDHPLAQRRSIRISDLGDLELLLLDDGHCLRDQALEICELGGARELGDFRATSLNTLARMVAVGGSVTLLPAMALRTEVRARDHIVTRALGRSAPTRTIVLAFRSTTVRREEFVLLADVLRDQAPAGTSVLRR